MCVISQGVSTEGWSFKIPQYRKPYKDKLCENNFKQIDGSNNGVRPYRRRIENMEVFGSQASITIERQIVWKEY